MIEKLRSFLIALYAWAVAQVEPLYWRLEREWKEAVLVARSVVYGGGVDRAQIGGGDRGLKGDVKIMVVGIVMVAIGVLLVAELDAALPTIQNASLSQDYETTLDNFGTGLTLVGVALIVVPAVGILRRMDVL